MQNLVKLVRRANLDLRGEALLAEYFLIFPEREEETRRFFKRLQAKKRAGDFSQPIADLETQLHAFVDAFEAQFRRVFLQEATRHVAFRHGPTAMNVATGPQRVFLGRSDPPLLPPNGKALERLAEQVSETVPRACHSSPLARCRQTLAALSELCPLPPVSCDERLSEIDYGELEGLTVSASRSRHADLFEAWRRGEDPKFPGGENTHDVTRRALAFVQQHWRGAGGDSIACTHNVVLRSLVGHILGLPLHDWHRLEVPHMAPITFVSTRSHGLFVDIPAETARTLFHDFALVPQAA
jgi:broad specificity phosphatase PhoE